MHIQTYEVKGMHCASCASIIKKTIEKTEGVESAEVNYGTEKAKVSFDESKTSVQALSDRIKPLGYTLVARQPAPAVAAAPEDHSGHEGHGGHAAPAAPGAALPKPNMHAEHTGQSQSKTEKLAEIASMRINLLSVIPLAVVSLFIMTWDVLAQVKFLAAPSYTLMEFFHHLLPIMATYTLLVVGKPYMLGFYRFLRYGAANMDTLIGIGTSVAFVYSFVITAFEEALAPYLDVHHTYYDVTIVVIAFITLGKYLEARAKLKTGDAIEKLLNLQAKTALVLRNGAELEIPIEQVIHGDVLVVKPGQRIPVDGIVADGSSHVDESMISGEPMPIKKEAGDTVVAGTINTKGSFTFKATKVGSETMLAHIIHMVEEAQGSQAPIQGLADKISAVFVPVVLGLSFLSLGLWLLIGIPALGFSQALTFGLSCFVGILVIACPCALGLATPTAIIVGVGKGAKEGILIKDAATLEKLQKVNVVVVDKTGTLTSGKPELVSIKNYTTDTKDEVLVSILASLEGRSEHPLALAITNYAKDKGLLLSPVSDFENIKGKGIQGVVAGSKYYAGNLTLLEELGVQFEASEIEAETRLGRTPIVLVRKNQVLALFMVADAIKPSAREAVAQLKHLGIKVVMLTGDNKNTAEAIAREAGIEEVVAQVLPEDKLAKIKELQAAGFVVAMAGDGVNDAPALAQADVGIAMGTGTDVAIETAGITLLHGDISKLVKALRLSKLTMNGIKQNLFWAFIYNIVGIPIAAGLLYPAFGILLNPVFAGLAMAFSSLSVVGNSLRLKAKKL